MQKKIVLLFSIFVVTSAAVAQSLWSIGGAAGVCVSKTGLNDTLAENFSTRNRLGGYGNIAVTYDLSRSSSLLFTAGYLNTGYKINNDTMAYNTSINKGISSISSTLGLMFKQQFNSSSFIAERFGVGMNYNLSNTGSDTFYNQTSNARYRIVQTPRVAIYPLFFLGFAMGGNTEDGNRYEFNVTFQQSFATSHNLTVQHSEFYGKSFPLTFRGGNLQIGFTYYFNLGNFQKTEEYFY